MPAYEISVGAHGSFLKFDVPGYTNDVIRVKTENRLDKTKTTIYIDRLSALGLAKWIEGTIGEEVK